MTCMQYNTALGKYPYRAVCNRPKMVKEPGSSGLSGKEAGKEKGERQQAEIASSEFEVLGNNVIFFHEIIEVSPVFAG